MIVFGKGVKSILLSEAIIMDTCPICKKATRDNISIKIYQRFFYIYWDAPILPLGKWSSISCKNCKSQIPGTKAAGSLRLEFDNLRNKCRTPLYMYTAPFLVTIVITLAVLLVNNSGPSIYDQIDSAAAGDLYTMEDENGKLTFYRVEQVMGERVIFQTCDVKSSDIMELSRKLKTMHWSGQLGFTKDELYMFANKRAIFSIDKKKR